MSRFFRKCHQIVLKNSVRFQHSKEVADRIQSVRTMYDKQYRKIDGFSLCLLIVPVSALGLGVWQVQRKRWKEGLIADLYKRTNLPPVEFPHDLTELSDMEYQPVRVVGTFDHSKELYIGPRSLIINGESSSNAGSIISSNQSGFYVVTPFTLSDRDLTILINRGWVPQKDKLPKSRQQGQIEGEVELIGVVRHAEERQPLTPQNKPGSGLWLYRDLNKMAEVTGAAPIFLDAIEPTTVPGGPIGGQTRITLRNEHMSYILTWFSLSGITTYMWYRHFVAKVKVV